MKSPTQNQLFQHQSQFYSNGIYTHKRHIFIGSTLLQEDNEITSQDLIDLTKSLYILEEQRTGDDSKDLITIHLSTIGGDIYLAMGFYDIIASCKSPVEIRCLGMCFSAGTVILQAGDYRVSYPNTSFMIHQGTVSFPDSLKISDVANEKEELDRVSNLMLKIYMSKLKITEKKLIELLKKDSFMSPQTAKSIGLIDEITTSLIEEE